MNPSLLKKDLQQLKIDANLAKRLRGLIKRNKKTIDSYSFYVKYLETSPSEVFIQKEIDRISNRINLITKAYVRPVNEYLSKAYFVSHKKNYEREQGVPKLRTQLAALCFIQKD